MDKSKINQTELSYSCGAGNAKVNLYTGRLFFEHPEISIGLKTYNLTLSHIYNSQLELPTGINTYMGNKWKLNVQQYLYQEGLDYYYIDGEGSKIRFTLLADHTYCDTTGLGLQLLVSSTYCQICDTAGNKMIFENNRLVKTISCENISIEKVYQYQDDKLVSIYDSRRPDHRIYLEYYHNLLSKISVYEKNLKKLQFQYHYNLASELIYVSKIVNEISKKYVQFSYRDTDLRYAVLLSNHSSMKIEYDIQHKVKNIQIGVVEVGTNGISTSPLLVGDNIYIGENHYLGETYQYETITFKDNMEVLTQNNFIYQDYCTLVTNEKSIQMVYYLNKNGYTVSILESLNESHTDLRTLKKMPGWSMLNAEEGTSLEKINTQKTFFVPTNKIISTQKGSLMSKRLSELQSYRNDKCTNYVNYICSFWLKITSEIKNPKIKLTIKSKEYIDSSVVIFDNSAINAWQEVQIPIQITYSDLKYIQLEFLENDANQFVYIGDMKLYYSSTYRVMVTDGNKWGCLDDAKRIQYVSSANPELTQIIDFNDDNYITEQDLQLTYLNYFKLYGNAENSGDFLFYYNDGTEHIMVKSASIVMNNNDNFPIHFASDTYQNYIKKSNTRAQYYTESLSPDGDVYIYCIPHFIPQYPINGKYNDCMCLIIEGNRYVKLDENGKKPEYHKESFQIVCMDLKGKKLLEQDEYGVQTIYEYDEYGIINKKIITNVNNPTEKLVLDVYTTNDSETIQDGITKQTTSYDVTYGNILKTESYGIKHENEERYIHEYAYSNYNQDLKLIKNNVGGFNTIMYNQCGQIVQLAPKKCQDYNQYGYKFKYDRFGDPTQFFFTYKSGKETVDDLLMEKEIDRLNGMVTTKYYRENHVIDESTTKLDQYGRIIETDINGQKIKYTRDKLWESPGATKANQIEDEIEGKTYTYEYDDFYNLKKYSIKSADGTVITLEKQKENEIYCTESFPEDSPFHSETSYSEIHYDDNMLLAPRVTKTNHHPFYGGAGNPIEYEYDDLGRIKEKKLSIYEGWSKPGTMIYQTRTYQSGTNLILNEEVTLDNDWMQDTHLNIQYDYADRGLLRQMRTTITSKEQEVSYNQEYKYNQSNQLIEEYNSRTDVTKAYAYNDDGSIDYVINNGIKQNYHYSNGKLESIIENGISKILEYDHFGNATQCGMDSYTWKRGNLLSSYTHNNQTTIYEYNGLGQKYKKILSDGTTIQYHYDNEKLISENWSNGNQIRYIYDLEGIIGIWIESGGMYYFVKDAMGNVVSILDNDVEIVRYEYDAFGNCNIVYSKDDWIAYHNPIRWKGLYLEIESNLYLINGNVYSPTLRQYLSMNLIENVLSNYKNLYALYPYQFTTSNPISMMYQQHNISSGLELVYDLPFKSWWKKFWQTPIGINISTGIALLALTIALWTGNVPGFFITLGSVGAILLVGGAIAGIRSKKQGKGGWNGFANYINDNWSQTLAIEMTIFIATIIISLGVSSIKNRFVDCFAEGTEVLTSIGLVSIEDIQVGDEVWAYDEETGEKALKKVVQIFRNTTKQWTRVEIESEEGIETITCTPGHKFYLPENKQKRDIGERQEHESYYQLSEKWVRAIDLKTNDKVLLENGKYGIIRNVTLQQLETPETTYNFEVEDYHTYYVGSNGILTHNTGNCGSSYGIYEDVDYHTTGNSIKNARPIDGQSALNNSYQISTNSPRRLGYSNNQLVVLDKTEIRVINNVEIPVYHGHVREYSELTNHMKNIAVKHFGFRR